MLNQPGCEVRIGAKEHKEKQPPGQGRHTIKNDSDFNNFLGKTIVLRVVIFVPQPFSHHRKYWCAQYKSTK